VNCEQIIDGVQDRGIALSVTPEYKLRVEGQESALSDDLLAFLKGHRDAIIDKLCAREFQYEVFRIWLPDDVGFVVKRLQHTSNRGRLAVVRQYHLEFDLGYQAEPIIARKRNAGGYRANSWLRELDIDAFCAFLTHPTASTCH
jgi:hypothetical protein